MIQHLIGNLPLTHIPVVVPGHREMTLLKIVNTDHAFLVWNDTEKAKTKTTMELSGQTIHFVCVCECCEYRRDFADVNIDQVLEAECEKNGIRIVFVRRPSDTESLPEFGNDIWFSDVHLTDYSGKHGNWEQRLAELTAGKTAEG